MTSEQEKWLAEHPNYQLVGPPRPGPHYSNCGTLYINGEFILSEPLKPIVLSSGCKLVGIKD